MMRLGLILLLSAMTWGREVYPPVPREALIRGEAAPGLARIHGRYLPFADFEELVRGVLVLGPHALRVEGEIFDWRPEAGAWVEFWGELEQHGEEYLLSFHNGRNLRDVSRAPRPTPEPVLGERAQLWLKVRRTGSEPFPVAMGSAEDGAVFALPPDYEGPWGIVCLEGTIGTLGSFWSLLAVTPCPEHEESPSGNG